MPKFRVRGYKKENGHSNKFSTEYSNNLTSLLEASYKFQSIETLDRVKNLPDYKSMLYAASIEMLENLFMEVIKDRKYRRDIEYTIGGILREKKKIQSAQTQRDKGVAASN